MPSTPFLSQIASLVSCHNPQNLNCTFFFLLQLRFSFFCSKYKLFTSEAIWKGEREVIWGGSNFSAQKRSETRWGGGASDLYWALQHFPCLGNIYYSAVWLCLVSLPTSYPHRQEHVHTQVWVLGDNAVPSLQVSVIKPQLYHTL